MTSGKMRPVGRLVLLPCSVKIILNIFLIYSNGTDPHVFCVIIYLHYITVCVSSRIEFRPSGPIKHSTVQPPTGWTVMIAWYALIQHLLVCFTALCVQCSQLRLFPQLTQVLNTAKLEYIKVCFHTKLLIFLFKQETSVFLSSKNTGVTLAEIFRLGCKTALHRKFLHWTLRLSGIPDKAPWEHKTSKRCTVGGRPAHNFSTVWKVHCKG